MSGAGATAASPGPAPDGSCRPRRRFSGNKPIKAPRRIDIASTMNKIFEKALKDGIKENRCTFGAKEVLKGVGDSKLVVVSQSLTNETAQKISQAAEKQEVPTVRFEGTSVALGKMCGLQFRVSTVSFNSLTETNIASIIKESEAA